MPGAPESKSFGTNRKYMKIKGALVGLGRVGFGYDEDLPSDEYVLSHARALSQHPNIEFVGAVDIAPSKISEFRHTYSVPVFPSVREMLLSSQPDLIIIATPTRMCVQVAHEILDRYSPSFILIEKPMSHNVIEAENLVNRCIELGVRLYVNYTRRSVPSFQVIKEGIQNGTYKGPFIGSAWYTNGIYNNGSHMINLFEFFFGELLDYSESFTLYERDSDFDLELNLNFENCKLQLFPISMENYSTFGFTLFGSNGVLKLEPGFEGLSWVGAKKDSVFSKVRTLSNPRIDFRSGMQKSQMHVLDSILGLQNDSNLNACTGVEGLNTLKNIERMVRSANG
jgi:predicted dehydrogenase